MVFFLRSVIFLKQRLHLDHLVFNRFSIVYSLRQSFFNFGTFILLIIEDGGREFKFAVVRNYIGSITSRCANPNPNPKRSSPEGDADQKRERGGVEPRNYIACQIAESGTRVIAQSSTFR